MHSVAAVSAVDPEEALAKIEAVWKKLITHFEGKNRTRLTTLLSHISQTLSRLKLARPPGKVPVISLIGEIFVRKDEFSRQRITAYLEARGFAVRVAPVAEYLCYGNYVINNNLGERVFSRRELLKIRLTSYVQQWWEWRIKTILSRSKLYRFNMVNVAKTIRCAQHLININFRGETILTVGLGLREIISESCGVISIGPFGCMPSRVAESILKKEMTTQGKRRIHDSRTLPASLADIDSLPFFALETDGTPFPLQIEANLEAFVVQARRLHEVLNTK
jgi:predicted nucleotide-binding protein (sugar kinase/HSP70/actin superfamily)